MSRQECKSKKWEATTTPQGVTAHTLCQLLPFSASKSRHLRWESKTLPGTQPWKAIYFPTLLPFASEIQPLRVPLWGATGRLAWAQPAEGSWKGLGRKRRLQPDKHHLGEGRIHLQTLEVNRQGQLFQRGKALRPVKETQEWCMFRKARARLFSSSGYCREL